MKYWVMPLLAAIAIVTITSCMGHTQHKRSIAVSIQPQRYLLEQIVGERFDVVCLLTQGSNPEAYEPNMSHLMNLEKSDAYFCIGNIGFELAIVEKAKAENPDLKVYDNSKGVELLRGSHGGHGDEVDPHIWTSVPNAIQIAKNMLEAVTELDGKHARQYEKNYAKLEQKLKKLDQNIHARIDSVECRSFIVWHPSLSYFARDYGMTQITMEHEGKEPSAIGLRTEIDRAKNSGAKIFFYQKEFDGRQIESINDQIGAKLVTINPLNYNWEEELIKITDALVAE